MISESSSHGGCTRVAKMLCIAQFVMREAKVVRASNQIHPCFQHIKALSCMPTCAGERGETFTHRRIEPLNQGGIELMASSCHVEQVLCLLKRSQRHLACHLHHPFLLGAFDHGGDTQVRPYLSTGSSPPCCLFHFFSKRPHDAVGVK